MEHSLFAGKYKILTFSFDVVERGGDRQKILFVR